MTPPVNAANKEYEQLRGTLERLAKAVIGQLESLEKAAAAFDRKELRAIVDRDKEIDDLELSLDRLARTFMELRAPLGPDFRFVMAALDIARNLERIGDCAEYVARHVAETPTLPTAFKPAWDVILSMMSKCKELLTLAHLSWQRSDARLAAAVPVEDDAVDALQKQARELMIRDVRAGLVDVEVGMQAVLIANKLESIADISSHIAESVVFIIQARQMRHEARVSPP